MLFVPSGFGWRHDSQVRRVGEHALVGGWYRHTVCGVAEYYEPYEVLRECSTKAKRCTGRQLC